MHESILLSLVIAAPLISIFLAVYLCVCLHACMYVYVNVRACACFSHCPASVSVTPPPPPLGSEINNFVNVEKLQTDQLMDGRTDGEKDLYHVHT